MNKILNIKQAIKISEQLKRKEQRVILVGGCFDILHVGHARFLREAKKLGDQLFVLLESDNTVKKIKGKNRPINKQEERAEMLSSLEAVDFVLILTKNLKNEDYDNLIINLKPNIIATTKGDKNIKHKQRQAKKIGVRLAYIKKINDRSTSKILSLL